MTRLRFKEEPYSLLKSESSLSEKLLLEFPEWDVLKELNRRSRRKRRGEKKSETSIAVRKYISDHPEIVERLQKEGKL